MPSSPLRARAFETIAPRAAAFSSALSLTAAHLREWIDEHRAAPPAPSGTAATLGAFAAGRIDPSRLAQVVAPQKQRDASWGEPLQQALQVLEELQARGEELFHVRVAPGEDLAAAVDAALAQAGRAFGAARLATLARGSQFRPDEHGPLLRAFPFRRWSTAERNIAPPLVIETAGGDAMAAGLAAYLDGNQAFALVVEGDAPPAPLARLISPGVLVAQTGAGEEAFAIVAGTAGPAVVAIMPDGAARFVHLPGGRGHGELEIHHLPAIEPRRPVGSVSAFQQQQDLRLLAALSAPATRAAPAQALAAAEVHASANGHGNGALPEAAPPLDLAGALASWLLSRVDLSDLEASDS